MNYFKVKSISSNSNLVLLTQQINYQKSRVKYSKSKSTEYLFFAGVMIIVTFESKLIRIFDQGCDFRWPSYSKNRSRDCDTRHFDFQSGRFPAMWLVERKPLLFGYPLSWVTFLFGTRVPWCQRWVWFRPLRSDTRLVFWITFLAHVFLTLSFWLFCYYHYQVILKKKHLDFCST